MKLLQYLIATSLAISTYCAPQINGVTDGAQQTAPIPGNVPVVSGDSQRSDPGSPGAPGTPGMFPGAPGQFGRGSGGFPPVPGSFQGGPGGFPPGAESFPGSPPNMGPGGIGMHQMFMPPFLQNVTEPQREKYFAIVHNETLTGGQRKKESQKWAADAGEGVKKTYDEFVANMTKAKDECVKNRTRILDEVKTKVNDFQAILDKQDSLTRQQMSEEIRKFMETLTDPLLAAGVRLFTLGGHVGPRGGFMGPMGPMGPMHPGPINPMGPMGPMIPGGPMTPGGPVSPGNPVSPIGPMTPPPMVGASPAPGLPGTIIMNTTVSVPPLV